MSRRFRECLPHILKHEGGYVDHPEDPGGATNMGITHITLASWRGCSVTKQDVKNLRPSEVQDIYKANYWDAAHCANMPVGIDLCVFDCAVNQGVGDARRFLQYALGVRVDGVVGPITLGAVSHAKPSVLLRKFMARRMEDYGNLSIFKTFGGGWSSRLMDTMYLATRMVG